MVFLSILTLGGSLLFSNPVLAHEDSNEYELSCDLDNLVPRQNMVRSQSRTWVGTHAYVVNNINGVHYGGYVPFSHREVSTGFYIYKGIAPMLGFQTYKIVESK